MTACLVTQWNASLFKRTLWCSTLSALFEGNDKKIVLMPEFNIQFKCIFHILLNSFKLSYSVCFSLGGNLDFPHFLQNNAYNIDVWEKIDASNYFEYDLRYYSKLLQTAISKCHFGKHARDLPKIVWDIPLTCTKIDINSVTKLDDLLDFGQLLKACGNN